jgi:hypothetical protein
MGLGDGHGESYSVSGNPESDTIRYSYLQSGYTNQVLYYRAMIVREATPYEKNIQAVSYLKYIPACPLRPKSGWKEVLYAKGRLTIQRFKRSKRHIISGIRMEMDFCINTCS